MLKIGIDPGVNTGVAVWDSKTRTFQTIATMDIDDALIFVANIDQPFEIWIENPNTFVPFERESTATIAARRQGAGSVKRDYSIWRRFCEKRNIKMHAVSLRNALKKLTANQFYTMTGYKGKTSSHARDAAMLVLCR